ncbi:hypothetical protein G4Y79_15130 [Phototrophicus methaneseepsis]|uniref:Uncharacterized protein n=1 Tax=Phototrophicus methaneseepsis TaxID=2710758 RepID=A0A7S8E637_9CHLR|nr:hypothetical protein [Phototrophicus methaneseepsis]QPC81035.1 hypothetical protein G4Y79_15130 [Phototrophicus methaneseepsis]
MLDEYVISNDPTFYGKDNSPKWLVQIYPDAVIVMPGHVAEGGQFEKVEDVTSMIFFYDRNSGLRDAVMMWPHCNEQQIHDDIASLMRKVRV